VKDVVVIGIVEALIAEGSRSAINWNAVVGEVVILDRVFLLRDSLVRPGCPFFDRSESPFGFISLHVFHELLDINAFLFDDSHEI